MGERMTEDRGIPPEVLAEYVEDECPTCGAYVLNPALHEQWHRNLAAAMAETAAEAKRYKSPPVYGGGR